MWACCQGFFICNWFNLLVTSNCDILASNSFLGLESGVNLLSSMLPSSCIKLDCILLCSSKWTRALGPQLLLQFVRLDQVDCLLAMMSWCLSGWGLIHHLQVIALACVCLSRSTTYPCGNSLTLDAQSLSSKSRWRLIGSAICSSSLLPEFFLVLQRFDRKSLNWIILSLFVFFTISFVGNGFPTGLITTF